MLLFSNFNQMFFGYFDPDFFYIIKIIIFRGELTDISAKKEALNTTPVDDARTSLKEEEHHACTSLHREFNRNGAPPGVGAAYLSIETPRLDP